MARSLEDVLGTWEREASVLSSRGHSHDAKLLLDASAEVRASCEDYLTWLSEDDAMLKTGKSRAWLRSRFAEWEKEGHAEKRKGVRWYRAIVLPQRSNESAFEEGRRAAQGDAAA